MDSVRMRQSQQDIDFSPRRISIMIYTAHVFNSIESFLFFSAFNAYMAALSIDLHRSIYEIYWNLLNGNDGDVLVPNTDTCTRAYNLSICWFVLDALDVSLVKYLKWKRSQMKPAAKFIIFFSSRQCNLRPPNRLFFPSLNILSNWTNRSKKKCVYFFRSQLPRAAYPRVRESHTVKTIFDFQSFNWCETVYLYFVAVVATVAVIDFTRVNMMNDDDWVMNEEAKQKYCKENEWTNKQTNMEWMTKNKNKNVSTH